MSSIVLSPGATGAAAFTIEAPSTATSRVITLPDATDTLVGKATTDTLTNKSIAATQLTGSVAVANGGTGLTALGPAFYAYSGATTSVNNATSTKVTLDSEVFDTNSCFASSRFTPTVAGYYQFSAVINFQTVAYNIQPAIFKNGSVYVYGPYPNLASAGNSYTPMLGLVSLNGSSDYVELYVYQFSGSTATVAANISQTWFQGFLARPA